MQGSTTLDINNELICVVASIGYSDGDDYFKGVDCVESLKDMIRFLKHEDKTCDIRRQIGCTEVLQNDLLPLLINCQDDEQVTDIVVRLLVNLTTPADVCFQDKEEVRKSDGTREAQQLELLSYLQKYKEAFTNQAVMAAIGAQLARILQLEWEDRNEDHNLLLERLLLLLRNVFHVPSNPDEEQRTNDDVSIHDQLLWNCHLNGIDDLLLYISSSPSETQWCMHALEITSLMLREQNPEKLAVAGASTTTAQKKKETRELAMIREAEALEKKTARERIGSRHSRFRGSFWVENRKGIDRKSTLVYHHNITNADEVSFDFHKQPAKKHINKREMKESNLERESTISIRMFLKEFCSNFVEQCYNPLMNAVKDNIIHKKAQDNDESYYLWSLRFFMSFNRHHSMKLECVRETLSVNTFQYILRQLFTYYDQMTTDKREAKVWAKRLHLALRCYHEILMYIMVMGKSSDEDSRGAATVMKSNIVYVDEYRDIFITLLRKYSLKIQARSYLKDLIETFHIYLKMLDGFTKQQGVILVKKKKRTARPKKKKNRRSAAPQIMTAEQLEKMWQDEVSPTLSKLVQSDLGANDDDEIVPFDTASDAPMDEQREIALAKIQLDLRQKDCHHALGLLRSARKVWPEETQFGNAAVSCEKEFNLLKEIFVKEFPAEVTAVINHTDAVVPQELEGDDAIQEVEDEEEEEEEVVHYTEKQFDISSFLRRLVDARVLQPYCHLLNYFEQNTAFTNHCITKMLHRIAVGQRIPAMLFQLSLFRTFDRILKFSGAHQYKELVDLARFILSKFFSMIPEKPMLFVEILFWKNALDCFEIAEGYGSVGAFGPKRREKWTFEEEEELKSLFDQYRQDEDPVQCILDNITDKTRTHRQIAVKLVRLKLVERAKDLPRSKKASMAKWSNSQNEELKRIFDESKESNDPVGMVCSLLSFEKSRNQVIKQLLDLGVVTDRKQLHKKRQSKKRKRNEFQEMVDDAEESDEENDEENQNEEPMLDHDLEMEDADEPISDNDFDSEDVEDLLDKVILEDCGSQLDWLKDRLTSVAIDRDEGEAQPIPLVTVTEEHAKALASKSFRRLLKAIGLRPPSSEQESFWRIPESLSSDDLRQHFDDIANASRRAQLRSIRHETTNGAIQPQEGISETTNGNSSMDIQHDMTEPVAEPRTEEQANGIIEQSHDSCVAMEANDIDQSHTSPVAMDDLENIGSEDEAETFLVSKRKRSKVVLSDEDSD